ncbi:MAG: glycosyltransferase family 39 protein, partial [Bacteroidota bacterium]
MLKNSRAFFYLLAATLFILISDGLTMRYKVLFGGDEIISFLCATGNADEYEAVLHKYTPYGKLTDAADWLKYTEITEPNCFNKIGKDLCSNDLHPPLYFWLLHLFVLKLGVHIFTGILLNLFLQLFSLFFIFKIASLIFADKNKGAFAALIWAISPACMMVSMNARPYELLELVSIIYLLNFYLWQKKATKLNAFLLAMIGTLG